MPFKDLLVQPSEEDSHGMGAMLHRQAIPIHDWASRSGTPFEVCIINASIVKFGEGIVNVRNGSGKDLFLGARSECGWR